MPDDNRRGDRSATGAPTLDTFKLLFDSEYRGQAIGLLLERGLPILGGSLIILVGVSFVLAGSKVGQAAGSAIEIVATKGKSLIGTGIDVAKEVAA